MKKLFLSVVLLVLGFYMIAQAPQSFKYQAVVRDLSGNIITNQQVAVKISILLGSESGTVVYSEVHTITTNQFGMITMDIGKGSVVTGIFSAIDWRVDEYFLKLEIDITGGTNFQFMGTSQLLSVPYALYSQTSQKFPTFTSAIRDTMTVVQEGACFYNSTTKTLNLYNGTIWLEMIGNCDPPPVPANAGPDQLGACSTTTLAGNLPEFGTGTWEIVSGTGGTIAEQHNPVSQFTGLQGNTYVLRWTISNVCGSTQDEVSISIEVPVLANAGPDQLTITSPTTLAGNNPEPSTGLWNIVSGIGGNIDNPINPLSQFSGDEGETYTLAWTITSDCGSNLDEVVISFICQSSPTIATAGPDQLNIQAVSTNLQGNTPVVGIGGWSIISGIGGNIAEPSNPVSSFTGLAGNSYTLRWTIATNHCGSTSDEVVISFWGCGQIFTDFRDNKTYPSVLIGSQCWMAKNMNVGTRIDGTNNQLNNSTIEKYCSANLESNCDEYGGLYQWAEMMQYVTSPGAQGICTPGWHLPTDAEWCTLEQFVDPTVICANTGDRGVDAGGKLKETGIVHWFFPNTGATNSSGFTALPGGVRNTDGTWPGLKDKGRFWTSNESSTNAYRRILSSDRADIARDAGNKLFGLSVRCLKD